MIPSQYDPITLMLAQPALACYAPNAVPTWQNSSETCQVFHSIAPGRPIDVIVFRGTETRQEWFQDFDPITVVDQDDPLIGWVHKPSLDNVRAVLPFIVAMLAAKGWPPFYLVGHSKGAREAPIAHALLKHMGHSPVATRCYEPPRPGGFMLADYLATENIIGTVTYNASGDDIVTVLPYGMGWEPAFRNLRVKVPDSFDLSQKHVMAGVWAGLGAGPP